MAQKDFQFIKEVEAESNQKISRCYQCGKCTASCPANFLMDFTPNQILRLLQLGQKNKVFKSRSIWLCLSCIACSARCPREIDLAAIFDALRIRARREKFPSAERRVKMFQNFFLNSIKSRGRIHELSLLLKFNMATGAFFNDVNLAPRLLGRGKLPFFPSKIRGVDQVAQIYRRLQEEKRS